MALKLGKVTLPPVNQTLNTNANFPVYRGAALHAEMLTTSLYKHAYTNLIG